VKSSISIRLLLVLVLLLITADRLPAPISEVETPTPAPDQSAKPKPKRTSKPKVTSESSETSTKRQMSSSVPTITPTQQSRFAGAWTGVVHTNLEDIPETITVDPTETTMTVTVNSDGRRRTATAERNGDTIKGRFGLWGTYSLTPSPDGSTALMHYQNILDDKTESYRRTTTAPTTTKVR
jgi:hypothetical protein